MQVPLHQGIGAAGFYKPYGFTSGTLNRCDVNNFHAVDVASGPLRGMANASQIADEDWSDDFLVGREYGTSQRMFLFRRHDRSAQWLKPSGGVE
jgi:hypothetical protein